MMSLWPFQRSQGIKDVARATRVQRFCLIFQRYGGKVTNNNMKKMVEWSVAANRAETGWLAAKLDTTEDRLSIRIQMVQDALATSNTAALQEAKEAGTPMKPRPSMTQQIPCMFMS